MTGVNASLVPRRRSLSPIPNEWVTDADFVHLAGLRELNMSHCVKVTDAAFVHLRGIHTLNMYWCNQRTITDAAFVHLAGIHTLWMAV